MINRLKLKNKIYFFMVYTFVFSIVCLGIFLPFIQEHKSFIWKADGLFQTFSSMVYVSEYYKSILHGLFYGSFNPKMVDFNIGLGYDVFTTLNYYGLGDPLLLFTIFFNKTNMYILYNSLVIVRLYLAGIGFVLFCWKMNKGKFQSLMGVIIYVFCGFAVAAGERHPYFLNGMIYLPFLLIGVENILKKKKSYLFTIMVFVSVVSNYYFFYMLTIMVFLYALIRFIDIYRIDWKNNILNILLRGIVQYLFGIMLAGFAFIPTIYAFLNNARGTTSTYDEGIKYATRYYIKMVYAFFGVPIDVNSNFTILAYAPLCVLVIIYMYFYKENFKRYKALKLGYLLATLMLCTPIAAYIMNGMSYPSNRWIFGYSFLTAFLVVCLLEDLMKISAKKLIPMAGIAILLVMFYLVVDAINERFTSVGVIYLIIMIAIIMGLTKLRGYYLKYGVILIATMAAIITFGYYYNASIGVNYVQEFRANGQEINLIENAPQSSIEYEADKSFYRIGNYGSRVENQSLTMGYNGTSSYYSIVDGNVLKYMKDMELTTLKQPHRFYGLDQRTYLETLASVKYYAFELNSMQKKRVPYGFVKKDEKVRKNTENADIIYKNDYTLPLGYTYEKKISTNYYNTLNSIQKQQSMLQAVVVEGTDNKDQGNVKYSEEKLDYILEENNGITWNKELGIIKINESSATLSLTFHAKKNCETYVRLEGLDIENSGVFEFTADVVTENSESKLYLTNSKYRWDLERENYLVNLGHNNDGDTTCTITFSQPGEYELKNIEVYSLPMTDYQNQVVKLGEEALTDIVLSNNKVTGDIEVSKDKTLCFSVLYNTGWKLKIDGESAPLYKANTMYMAADIAKGVHTIELSYQTPGSRLGWIISLLTLFVLIVEETIIHFLKNRLNK